tara:strand:- start:279 stop:917 length:639 start_codon:yes stop_codon:yes gene_type:complete
MNIQKIFNFDSLQNFNESDFIVSHSNDLAYRTLLNNKNLEKYIYLKGPNKSGKTHLGKLWQVKNQAILYKINNYDEILSKKNNLFIDNFNSKFNEEKLFHLINHSYQNNLRILITSKYSTSENIFKIKDLSSRIKSFHYVEIKDPDDKLIENLLIKLLNDKQIIIKNYEIFSYIIKRINRTYLDIYQFIDKIDKLSLSKKRQITIPLIKELL